MSLDFAAAAYSADPSACLIKRNATLQMRRQIPCDAFGNECWAFVALSPSKIVFTVRGTRTSAQLVLELVETMTAPKKTFPAGGSVQHYFYASLDALWNVGFGKKLRELKLPSEILLLTFGQPRVGNIGYANSHDQLVPNSFRIVHRYDLIAHLPYCYESLLSPHRCIPLRDHGPFHHGTEIWYPSDEMDPNQSLFVVCTGRPFGEDDRCSNAHYVHFGVGDHFQYFGRDVDLYGSRGCGEEGPMKGRRRGPNGRKTNIDNRTLRKRREAEAIERKYAKIFT
uniref:Lipase_3 domain-containing protein n=1 Tax=Globodera pallida TaxID=36090 RepID=A0A183BJ09_GLOPA